MKSMDFDEMTKNEYEYCFMIYGQFRKDFLGLEESGILKYNGVNTYSWLKTKTSLAEYFNWIGNDVSVVPGGFWCPIETAFGLRRQSLAKLLYKQQQLNKPSNDFEQMKSRILEYRELLTKKEELAEMIRRTFSDIRIIVDEAENNKIDTEYAYDKILDTLMKIKETPQGPKYRPLLRTNQR